MKTKADIRREIRHQRTLIAPERLAEEGECLMRSLEAHPRFQSAGCVALFHSLPDEPDTHALIERWQERKVLLLPAVVGANVELRCCNGEGFRRGAFGIVEPASKAFIDYDAVELIVVPGVAFDSAGHRLGRGKGYYDRLLSIPQLRAWKLGLCYRFQLVESLPCEGHDVLMDEVLCGPRTSKVV